jgi:hypothetical protein
LPDEHVWQKQCGTALLLRRIWAIPVAVFGWLILTGLMATWLHDTLKAPEAEAH